MPGLPELLIIMTIVLLLFGYKRVPQLLQGLGESIVGFKRAMKEANEVGEEMERDGYQADRRGHLD